MYSTTPDQAAEIVAMATTLYAGQSARGICPKCKGGDSKEKSFLVSRDLGSMLRFICFRATCRFYGRQFMGTQHVQEKDPLPMKASKLFKDELTDLADTDVEIFRDTYGINLNRMSTFWCEEKKMYAHKVRGPSMEMRGWTLRDYLGIRPIKALHYPSTTEQPFISWDMPIEDYAPGVVVVEDWLSAKKVSDAGMKAVALLGTFIDFERAYEIKAYNDWNGPIYLALDRGTMHLLMKYKDKFGIIWGDNVEVWSLKDDLKYVSRKRIREAVDGKRDFIGDDRKQGVV